MHTLLFKFRMTIYAQSLVMIYRLHAYIYTIFAFRIAMSQNHIHTGLAHFWKLTLPGLSISIVHGVYILLVIPLCALCL